MAVTYRSRVRPGRDGFAGLVRAEWIKFWTVRRRALALVATMLVIMVFSLLGAAGGNVRSAGGPPTPTGPGGVEVVDAFRFVHQGLDGDGSVTAHVASLTSRVEGSAATEPWAKGGIIIKASTRSGSRYVALLRTAGHGARLQYDYTHDRSVRSGSWLRLTRSGAAFTGYVSSDGTRWSRVGTVRVPQMPRTAQAGLFAASPRHSVVHRRFGVTLANDQAAHATAVFDHVALTGEHIGAGWTGTTVGDPGGGPAASHEDPAAANTSSQAGGTFTVTGTGNIAPVSGGTDLVENGLQGALVGLLVVIALGALFMTSEYRHGTIHTTFTASPRRGRVLAAKAVVIGAVTFGTALAALGVTFPLAQARLRASGFRPPGFPRFDLTDATALRAVGGMAALIAVAAVLALAVGAVLRHSAGAITAVVVLFLIPQILVAALPLTAAQWLMRVTPAAGFAVLQSRTYYPQAGGQCMPDSGCYPLSPWAGFVVPCVYAAVALGLAWWLTRRRDA